MQIVHCSATGAVLQLKHGVQRCNKAVSAQSQRHRHSITQRCKVKFRLGSTTSMHGSPTRSNTVWPAKLHAPVMQRCQLQLLELVLRPAARDPVLAADPTGCTGPAAGAAAAVLSARGPPASCCCWVWPKADNRCTCTGVRLNRACSMLSVERAAGQPTCCGCGSRPACKQQQ
jgi:hypothetical protein